MCFRNARRIIVSVAALAVMLPIAAMADDSWTSVGSAGVMDETEYNPVTFTMSSGSLSRAAGVTATVEARYNVTNIKAPNTPSWNTLEMGNFDNSTTNQVTAQLIRVNRCTGTSQTLCSVTSTNSASSKCETCTFVEAWNFDSFAYYIYVTLSGQGTNPQPALRTLRLYENLW